MRPLVLILALVSVASAARAEESRESRYGPRPSRPPEALAAAKGYSGPILGWAGKQSMAATPRAQASQPMYEPWRNPGLRPQATAPSPVPAAQAQAQAEPPLSEPWRNLGSSAPSPATVPAPLQSTASQAQLAPGISGPSGALPLTRARTYSVGRQYGLQPDPLPPLQPNGMVFIAPSDEVPRLKDDEPRQGSAEWPLAGAPSDQSRDHDGQDRSL